MKPIQILNKLNESYATNDDTPIIGVYQCNDCGASFDDDKVGPGYTCPYCTSGDIIEPDPDESISILKDQLQDLADKSFNLDMKDHWEPEDYALDTKITNDIKSTIKQLQSLGVDVEYKHGYPIKYKSKEEN